MLPNLVCLALAIAGVAEPGSTCQLTTWTLTAYTDWNGNQPGRDPWTASGAHTAWGVAACRRDLPFGTTFWVPWYGRAVCLDRGALAAHGIDADLWFPTVPTALRWGRRSLPVVLITPPPLPLGDAAPATRPLPTLPHTYIPTREPGPPAGSIPWGCWR
jgi:3D (Asp-Asp-Asp) domain-containing protein